MKQFLLITGILFHFLFITADTALAQEQRFPKPEFENEYQTPKTFITDVRYDFLEYLDVLVLLLALSFTSYFVLKKRSRNGVLLMTVFSLAYFGFYREGCVCSVGAVQNVALALFNPDYAIPVTAILFFVIPLLFTLFFGRTFCAGVCPLGAIQDIVALKPMSLPKWIKASLGLIPYAYLAFALLFAATSSDFIICRYDPFVGIFRFNAPFSMFALAAVFLIVGIFIARPYCRFFCPYGVLLNWMSRFSKTHMSITPSKCIQCPLCENSCPFDAIDKPTNSKDKQTTAKGVARVKILFAVLPLLVLGGGALGFQMHETFAGVNNKVHLAKELLYKDKDADNEQSLTLEVEAFQSKGKVEEELFAETLLIIKKYKTGSTLLGGFMGLVFGITLISLSRKKYRTDYEPNRAECFSCARCMNYCPVKTDEHL